MFYYKITTSFKIEQTTTTQFNSSKDYANYNKNITPTTTPRLQWQSQNPSSWCIIPLRSVHHSKKW
jgi:hypothetical protein